MALTSSSDPLVWIDCEMTGLNPPIDRILSISCFITSHDLKLVDSVGFHAIIKTPRVVLNSMDEWCRNTHGRTGLTQACLVSTTTAEEASEGLLAYLKQHVPEKSKALLAGNSVHADKLFLMQQPWVPILDWLHYRIFDVSAIKEAARRWCSREVLGGVPVKELNHSAEDDVKESIEEARYYMGLFKQMSRS
ncbi:hypothetical protein BT93_L4473 [Corymbia citriodora subsp. variegata]|uniref:Exonuclease domain-containing protein n=1 Tax=Corymbia citriodora subsp. variegata TaxID=360336 RepID=A0A8T0CFT8_CORYI|nr:hypothetical protein BT93_L4473 [Corymbia citriodora subsp. variegata]